MGMQTRTAGGDNEFQPSSKSTVFHDSGAYMCMVRTEIPPGEAIWHFTRHSYVVCSQEQNTMKLAVSNEETGEVCKPKGREPKHSHISM